MGKQTLSILFVEDHEALADNLLEFFDREPYVTDLAHDGLTALHLLATNQYDVVVLDVMLPGIDGFKICEQVRTQLQSNVPIIMLTALDDIESKTTAFSKGVDDYLAKPFDMRELELRIQALSRRHHKQDNQLQAGDIIYSPGTLTLSSGNGTQLTLSGHSATVFDTLIRAYPSYIKFSALSQALWGIEDGDEHTIRTHVYVLRKQLKQTFGRAMIKSLYGRGYQLDPMLE